MLGSCSTRLMSPREVSRLSWKGSIEDRKSTRLNSSHLVISYAVFCLKQQQSVCLLSNVDLPPVRPPPPPLPALLRAPGSGRQPGVMPTLHAMRDSSST